MNVVGGIVLAAIILDAAVNLWADILNLRQVRGDLPSAFQGWYDPQRYRQSQHYLIVNTRFGWLTSGFDLACFWCSGSPADSPGWINGCADSNGRR